ncbi:MAG: GtrA family protein [Vibrio casei]|uniref:GtrA family protein n=2 Tax=Vibrio casei TaxID=673372 RepID=UPI003F95D36E
MKRLNNLIYTDFKQKVRFGLVGAINTVAAYMAFVVLYQVSGQYILSSVLSYFVGMLVSYTLNRRFVFNSDVKKGQFLPFCIVNLTSLGCSTAVLYLLVHYGGVMVYLAQALTVCSSMVINYLGYQKVFTNGVSMQLIAPFLCSDNNRIDWQKVAKWGLFIVLATVTLFNVQMSVVSNIAHDALPYMEGYSDKFVSEGRWINFALFYTLRAIPSPIAVILCDAFIFYFGYRLALGVRKDTWFALCFGLLIVSVPYFTMLFKWPMTLIPGCLMLALFAYVKDKVNPYALLIVSGILLFATYPAFYFLMPLLFLLSLSRSSYFDIFKFLCVWALGYILGYIVANGLVYAYTYFFLDHGSFIEFASWRRAEPLNSLDGLIENVKKSSGNFERNALYISNLSPWLYCPIVLTSLWALKNHVKYTIIVFLVVISIYASVIAMGVTVPLRSGITLPIGLSMMLLLVSNKFWRTFTLLLLFISFAYQMHDYNSGYTSSRTTMASILEKNDSQGYLKQPNQFKKIVVSVDQAKTSDYMHKLTGSNAFKTLSNLRYHFIQPYLYKQGWPRSKIEMVKVSHDTIRGVATIKKEEDVLFLYID